MNKIQVIIKNIHEIKKEILRDYAGEFEMVDGIKIADQTRETHIRFRNIDHFDSYINAIDHGYESEDAVFNGYNFIIKTPHFN